MYRQWLPLLPALDVRLELGAELADRGLHRPAGAVRQAANRRPGNDPHAVADFDENIEVLDPPAAAAHAVENAKHPRGPLAARRALPARFVREKPAGVPEHVNHRSLVVDHGDRASA